MTEAADPLSFVLFGVPRSGTSALADALNLQPDVFCGHERLLGYRKWTSRQEIIDALLAAGSNNPGAAVKKNLGHLSRKIDGSQPFIIGDKAPEYYINMKQITKIHPTVKKICIYRSPYGFAPSWDVRANNIHDNTWERGRIGIFGIFDLLMMFHIIQNTDLDATVVSYAALFQDGVRVFPALVEQITGHPAAPEVLPAFRKQFFQRRKEGRGRAEASPYRELLQSIEVDGIDAAIRERRIMPAQRLKAITRGYVETAAPRVARSIIARLADLPSSVSIEVAKFGHRWVQTRLAALHPSGRDEQALRGSLEAIQAALPALPADSDRASDGLGKAASRPRRPANLRPAGLR